MMERLTLAFIESRRSEARLARALLRAEARRIWAAERDARRREIAASRPPDICGAIASFFRVRTV